MEVQRIQALLEKHAKGQLSEQEMEELSGRLAALDEAEKEKLADMYTTSWDKAKQGQLSSVKRDDEWQEMLDNVLQTDNTTPLWKRGWLRYAAVFILVIGGVLYLWMQEGTKAPAPQQQQVSQQPVEIKPGRNTAVLTLSNGQVITLDSAANGSLAVQGSTEIIKQNDGTILYKDGKGSGSKLLYNTISVPKGGQYRLTLPDGTNVWLNALSVLHYPVSFTGNKRLVKLEGEAYFEVAHNKAMPFEVSYKDTKVEVLGTHFNVMAYEDELSIQTTVLEGKVRVQQENNQQVLTPGKQARIDRTSSNMSVKEVPADMYVAWKNGYFHFDKADMATVLRQLARWYDLDIEYQGKVTTDLFSGKIERGLPLERILYLLKQSNLKFELKGRTLVVFNAVG